MASNITQYKPDESIFGAPRAQNGLKKLNFFTYFILGRWASAVRMIEPKKGKTLCFYELPDGEAAFR